MGARQGGVGVKRAEETGGTLRNTHTPLSTVPEQRRFAAPTSAHSGAGALLQLCWEERSRVAGNGQEVPE